ncbi:DsbC family protein [Variovorax sp. ZS18.2.2]|uniref:DsbC family protein n=1 Tax=Variovorax sp. ZS18.2.2 TaxID=2971255 RepID=UPI0021514347|nr:DsbC family protein [Variovorax sp. ZS18.2.2]MCR6481006.1 DsbC family protein [Variovorax sp. ZS18.2.2]
MFSLRSLRSTAATVVQVLALSMSLCTISTSAHAGDVPAVAASTLNKIRAAVQANTQGKVPVDAVAATPIAGVYQIASGGEVFYVDTSGRYSFVGGVLIDTKTQADLTQPVLDKLQAIDFKSLPLELAIKEVHGNGSRKMALFEDPNCPICRVFTKFVDQIEDVTVYRFIYPVISPQSEQLARVAWCSSDRASTWKSIMNGARPAGSEACDTRGIADILKIGMNYRIQNTPTVVLASGKRLVGATPPENFLQELEAGGR